MLAALASALALLNPALARAAAPAARSAATPRCATAGLVIWRATARAVLRILDAGATSGCGPVSAAGLRVSLPGQPGAKVVPFPFEACSRAGEGNLLVRTLVSQG